MDQQPSTSADFGNHQGYSQGPLPYGHNQWNDQSQPSYQQPPLYSTAPQIGANHSNTPQYNEQAEEPLQDQYYRQAFQGDGTNPALLTTARPVSDDMFHSAGYNDQMVAIGEQFSQSAGPWESETEYHGPQDVAQYSTGHDVNVHVGRAIGQWYDTRIDAGIHLLDDPGNSTANGRCYEPLVDGQESIPISTVLGRAPGYDASLVHTMRQVPKYQSGHPSGPSMALTWPIDFALGQDQTATVPPQASDVFSARQQPDAWRCGQVIDTPVPGIICAPSALNNVNRAGSNPPTRLVSNDQLQAHEHALSTERTPSVTSSVPGGRTRRCSFRVCGAVYSGFYASGNLARHIRLKHRGEVRRYQCEADGCTSAFNRQDARLNHYRKHHPDLAAEPAVLRKTSTSTGRTSDQDHMDCSPSSYSHTSLCESQGLDDYDVSSLSFNNDGERH